MKLRTLLIAVLSLVATAIMAQTTAYAVYCEGSNTEEDPATLYFLASETEPTGTHNGQNITQTWSGTEVTGDGAIYPAWRSKVKSDLKRVIFETSFADVKPTSCNSWFDGCEKLTTIEGIENLNTAEVTGMHLMFLNCTALETLDLSSFNTAVCTDIQRMFRGCSALKKLTLGAGFTAEKVDNMSQLFYNCSALETLDLSSFKTAEVTNMNSMFDGCAALKTLDLSNFNTANVLGMAHMFYNCAALETLDLSSFNTAEVTNMTSMFDGCAALENLDLSSFNTAKCTKMKSMFNNCSALKTLNLSSFTTEKNPNMTSMFEGCSALKTLDLRSAGKAADMVATNSGFAKRGMVIYLPDDADVSGDVFEENYVVKPAAGSTSFARTFTGGNTSTVCLPFAVNTAEMTDGTFYEFKACDDKTVKFVKPASDETVADKAYLFKPAADGKVTFTGTAIEGLPETTEGEADGLYGVYAEKKFTKDEADKNIYYGWSAGNFVSIGEGATLSHGRGYLKLAQTSGAKNILKAVFDDETTGISEVNAAAEADATAYDLTGRRVSAAYKGIVIKNGKKMMR